MLSWPFRRGHRPAGGEGEGAAPGWHGLRFQQQYMLAAAVFALAVVGIILLFGHLISRSLSKRYLEDVLVAGRADAQQLAGAMAKRGGTNVYDVIEKNREVLQQHVAGLAQKLIFQSITVTDKSGHVVYRASFQSRENIPAGLATKELEVGGNVPDQVVKETQNSYQIPAPIGKVGEVILSVSKRKLARRVVRLRRHLLQQTVIVAAATLATLVGAFIFVWYLIQRTQGLEAKRKEAEELAALGSLAANLAHEIRNPLNSINLNLEMLEEDLQSGRSAAWESLASTRHEVSRLSRLMTDFLTYARPQGVLREPVRLAPLLHNLEAFLREEAKAAKVHLRLDQHLPDITVPGDEGQLRQVLINLVLNAIQAVRDLDPARRVVELVIDVREDAVALLVRDRGPGVPEEEIGRIKEAFYTKRPGGTGLGLAVAERVARNHDGYLSLRNLDSQGFEAGIVLPLPDEDVKMSRD